MIAVQFGIADRWKWTICQSAARLAMTNVSRPARLSGLSAKNADDGVEARHDDGGIRDLQHGMFAKRRR